MSSDCEIIRFIVVGYLVIIYGEQKIIIIKIIMVSGDHGKYYIYRGGMAGYHGKYIKLCHGGYLGGVW